MLNDLDYIELICKIQPNLPEHSELLTAYLISLGFESFMETEHGMNAYIPKNLFLPNDINKIEKRFSEFKLELFHQIIKDENWNETWTKNYFEPIIFEKELVVRASFHPKFPEIEKEIIMDPKTAFGTGNHATTYMLIEEILKMDISDKSVLDMGTGTGILAILSKKKHSGYTYAVDNDLKAVINTSENIIINNTKDIEIGHGDITILKDEMFDIMYENIWKNIVIKDIPILFKHLKPEGILLTSGFYYKEFEDVKTSGEKAGFSFLYAKEKDGWAIVKFIKK